MAAERVGTYEVKTHLSEYVNRVRYGGERIVIERHGKPVAALVSTKDLERIEASPEDLEQVEAMLEDEEARYRKTLEEAGIEITYPTGKRSTRKRRRIKVKGNSLSEQIIADRR